MTKGKIIPKRLLNIIANNILMIQINYKKGTKLIHINRTKMIGIKIDNYHIKCDF